MLGLDYSSDSEDELPQDGGERQAAQGVAQPPAAAAAASADAAAGKGKGAPPRQQQGAAPPASALPSAEALLGGSSTARLPPPDFGSGRAAAGGTKRAHPDTRGPLPNPMALESKVQRSGAAQNVGAGKPATGGMLVPPQLRGRANVATEDLSVFTKQSQAAAKRRSGGGGGGGSGAT